MFQYSCEFKYIAHAALNIEQRKINPRNMKEINNIFFLKCNFVKRNIRINLKL